MLTQLTAPARRLFKACVLTAMVSTIGSLSATAAPAAFISGLLGSYVPVPSLEDPVFAALANPQNAREMLMSVAVQNAQYTSVPYIWGGNNIGDQSSCDQCRECLYAKRHMRVAGRVKACQVCNECGVDCSHFVNNLHRDAGLDFPYLDTSKMRRSPRSTLLEKYNLVDVGKSIDKAEPGDLLVHPRHVVMLLRRGDSKRGDFIHVSRSTGGDRLGGIQIVRDADLMRFGGPLVRILRHKDLNQAQPQLAE